MSAAADLPQLVADQAANAAGTTPVSHHYVRPQVRALACPIAATAGRIASRTSAEAALYHEDRLALFSHKRKELKEKRQTHTKLTKDDDAPAAFTTPKVQATIGRAMSNAEGKRSALAVFLIALPFSIPPKLLTDPGADAERTEW